MSEELKIIVTLIDQASGPGSKIGGVLNGLGGIAKGALTVGLGAATVGVGALAAGLFKSIGAASGAEDVQADLNATLLSTKGIAGVTAEEINKMASAFQNTTRFEDDVTVKGASMLLTFTNIGKDVFPAATEAMLNMGQKFGSVDAAALQLGKALNDPIAGVGALRRVGVQLTDQQEEQIKKFMAVNNIAGAQKIILGELQTEFGGLAEAAGSTFAGKLDIVKNKFGDVMEKIGGAVLPGLTLLADALIKTLDNPVVNGAIDSISKWLADVLPKAIEAGSSLLKDLQEKGLTGVLKQAQAWVNDPNTQAMLRDAGSQAGQGIVGGIRAAVTSVPMWVELGKDLARVAVPIMVNVGAGIGQEILNAILRAIGIEGRVGLGGGGGLPGFANGGTVPGPLGAPQLAIVHGGEHITQAGGGNSDIGGLTFVYAPGMSLASKREIQTELLPMLDEWYRGATRRRALA